MVTIKQLEKEIKQLKEEMYVLKLSSLALAGTKSTLEDYESGRYNEWDVNYFISEFEKAKEKARKLKLI